MDDIWRSAAEQTVDSLQSVDDFAMPDLGAAEPSALTANSISDTHHELDADLPGDFFDMTSGNPDDQQLDEMLNGSYHLTGNQIPNARDDFLYRVTQHMEATQNPVMQHVATSDQRMAQQAEAKESERRYQTQAEEAESKERDLKKEINDIKVELAAIREENTILKNNYKTLEGKWMMRYKGLEKEKMALESELELVRKQSRTTGPEALSVESAVADTTATTVDNEALAHPTSTTTPAIHHAAISKSDKAFFTIDVYKFDAGRGQWERHTHNGKSMSRSNCAFALQTCEQLVKAVVRGNRNMKLSIKDAKPVFKVRSLRDNNSDEAGEVEVNTWLQQVRRLGVLNDTQAPVMKLGWYSPDNEESRRALGLALASEWCRVIAVCLRAQSEGDAPKTHHLYAASTQCD